MTNEERYQQFLQDSLYNGQQQQAGQIAEGWRPQENGGWTYNGQDINALNAPPPTGPYGERLTNQVRQKYGMALDPDQTSAHMPGGWDFQRLGDFDSYQNKPVTNLQDFIDNFQHTYAQSEANGDTLNRPWNHDADSQKQGQQLVDMFNQQYGGHVSLADLPNTAFANSLPAEHKGFGSVFSGILGGDAPGMSLAATAALGGTGALSGLTGAGNLIDTGMGWLDKAILAAGKGGISSFAKSGNPITGAINGGVNSSIFSGLGANDWFNVGGNTPINSPFDAGKTMSTNDELFGSGGGNWWDSSPSTFGSGTSNNWIEPENTGGGNFTDSQTPSWMSGAGGDGPSNGMSLGDLAKSLGLSPSILGALIQGGSSVLAGRTQAGAANNASQNTRDMFNQTRGDLMPYQANGLMSLSALQGAMPQLLHPFGMEDFKQSPAYQFNLAEGEKAIGKAAAARGNYYAPQTLQDVGKYSQGVASNEFQNAFSNYNTSMNNIFSRLNTGVASGQNAASQTGNFSANAAGQIGNNITGAGNANAAGIVGAGNAVNNGITNDQNRQMIDQILSRYQTPTYS